MPFLFGFFPNRKGNNGQSIISQFRTSAALPAEHSRHFFLIALSGDEDILPLWDAFLRRFFVASELLFPGRPVQPAFSEVGQRKSFISMRLSNRPTCPAIFLITAKQKKRVLW